MQTDEPKMREESTPEGAWTMTLLLFFYMLVNFADKIVVGLAGVPIMAELELTPKQFGLLGSSFFFLFSSSASSPSRRAGCYWSWRPSGRSCSFPWLVASGSPHS